MDPNRIIEALGTLTLTELERVDTEIHQWIDLIRDRQRPEYTQEQEQKHSKTYQQEMVKCGKAGCKKCSAGGAGHGPYWYAYWSEDGRTRKKYIGKTLREV